jgi:Protein of unknown function (DUF2721)
MTSEEIGRAIQLILAPVVMFSACSIFVGGVLGHYTSIGDRIRALTRERLDLLRALRGNSGDADGLVSERLAEIDGQLPEMLHRHRLVHHAVLAVYAAIGILVLTMCVIALTATVTAGWVAPLAFAIFLASVLMMLVGVVLVTVEIRFSRRSLVFEAQRVTRLSAGVTAGTVSETNRYGSFVSAPAPERA